MKYHTILGAISTDNGDVSVAVLGAINFRARTLVNQLAGLAISGKDVVVMDQMLAETLGFDNETLPKPVNLCDAVTLAQATLVALAEWSKYTEADAKGRRTQPFAWLQQSSMKTGKPHLRSIPQALQDTADYRVSEAMKHLESQVAILKMAGGLSAAEIKTMTEAHLAARKADQEAEMKSKLALLGDLTKELKTLVKMDKFDLYELIADMCKACQIDDSIVQETAQRQIDFARDRLMRGEWTNLDPEMALLAK